MCQWSLFLIEKGIGLPHVSSILKTSVLKVWSALCGRYNSRLSTACIGSSWVT